jgi:hypothetical protein
MSAPHYLVFIGATPSLSTELLRLQSSYSNVRVIALAARKSAKGTSEQAIQSAISNLKKSLAEDGRHNDEARLSVWAYEFASPDEFRSLWEVFGCAAWIEVIPARFRNQDRLTRIHIQERITSITPLIHAVASEVYGHRATSPLPLPFQNFKSKLIRELHACHVAVLGDRPGAVGLAQQVVIIGAGSPDSTLGAINVLGATANAVDADGP